MDFYHGSGGAARGKGAQGAEGRIGLRRSRLSRLNYPQMTQMGADRDVPPFRFSQARWPTSITRLPWSAIHAGVLGCADLVPHVPAQHRQSCLGCPIALLRAARFVRDGRFQLPGVQQGPQVLLAEVFPVLHACGGLQLFPGLFAGRSGAEDREYLRGTCGVLATRLPG